MPDSVYIFLQPTLQTMTSSYFINRKLLFRNGKMVELGTVIKDQALAKTLERIRDNPEDFYTGALAEDIVKDIQDAGGIISLDDLANYKVAKRKALTDEIGDLTLYTLPAPSGGPVVTYILNILKGELIYAYYNFNNYVCSIG